MENFLGWLEFAEELRKAKQKKVDESNLLGQVCNQDLVDYGFLPEFIGRLPIITCLTSLSRTDLKRILTEPEDSIINHYKSEMASFGIELEFTEGAYDAIADKAIEYNTGARSLHTICEDTLRLFKYELPGSGINRLQVTEEMFKNPEAELMKIIKGGKNVIVRTSICSPLIFNFAHRRFTYCSSI